MTPLTFVAVVGVTYLLTRCVPSLVAANGHRPFLVGYLGMAALVTWGLLETLAGERASFLEERRVIWLVILVGTFEWAAWRHR